MPLSETSTAWIAVGLAIGFAAAAVVLAVAMVVVVVRARRLTREEAHEGAGLQHVLEDSNRRFEGMLEDLSRELEQAREGAERSRQLAAIAGTLEVDTVLTRALEGAAELAGVDATMIVLQSDDDVGEPMIASLGLSAQEAARQPVMGPPDGARARAVAVSYRYDGAEGERSRDVIHGGLAVPLEGEENRRIGTLAVFWRDPDRQPSDIDLATIEDVAAACGPAIEHARRFREARQLADLDALTGLHNRRYFHETLAREVARAHRYGRRLSLVIFDIDDFKEINDRVGHLAGDAVLAELAGRVQTVVRTSDIACRVGGDEFGVVLPESGAPDAEQLYRRLQFAVAARPTGSSQPLKLSAGIAELQSSEDAVAFFERADEALYRAKEAGKGQSAAANEG